MTDLFAIIKSNVVSSFEALGQAIKNNKRVKSDVSIRDGQYSFAFNIFDLGFRNGGIAIAKGTLITPDGANVPVPEIHVAIDKLKTGIYMMRSGGFPQFAKELDNTLVGIIEIAKMRVRLK